MLMQQLIEKKLKDTFNPIYLNVMNESHMHNVPAGSESHFKVVIVTNHFKGDRLIGRHQKINSLLKEELKDSIHAFSMETYTESEWAARNKETIKSPLCHGGDK